MASYEIRVFGDPVLRQRAAEVDVVDGAIVRLVEGMIQAMYDAPGLGVAAPQVGVQKRLFVYDLHDGKGAQTIINPVIKESRGEWTYDEGCLSVPELSWEIVRPREIHLVGYDLEGNEVDIEASDLAARLYQHELDHLDGRLLLELLEEEDKREAMRILRQRILDTGSARAPHKRQPALDEAAPAGREVPGLHLPGLGR